MAPALNLPPPTHGVSDELRSKDGAAAAADAAPQFPSSGLIYPPPDLRAIVDKTAAFVARVGAHFEARIREQEKHNQKFSFLNENDAYHAYYRRQTEAAQRGESTTELGAASNTDAAGAAAAVQEAVRADQEAAAPEEAPEEPPAHEFSLEFPSVPAVDLDVLKLTALFTARKGQGFAAGLLAREARSYQFEFLRPTHSLFSYFNLLVEQYRRVMYPEQALLERVRRGAFGDPSTVSLPEGRAAALIGPGKGGPRSFLLDEARRRARWEKWHSDRRKEARDEEKKRRAAFDEIDWQDFVVVGVVELTDTDEQVELPPPQSLRELQSMSMAQKRMAAMRASGPPPAAEPAPAAPAPAPAAAPEAPAAPAPPAEPEAAEDDMQMGSDEESAPPTDVRPGGVKIRHDYVRGARQPKPKTQTTVCPVCHETVPVNEMGEHVRVELLNPRFREERRKLEQRKEEQASLAAGADPSRFLRQFAGARTDIFGAQADEEAQARREAEQRRLAKQKERIIWDGHANSRVTAQDLHQRNQSLDEQMAQLQQRGRAQPAPANIGPQVPGLAPPAPKRPAAEHQDAPRAQAPRVEPRAPAAGQYAPPKADGALYPEEQWLAMHPYPISLHIRLPNARHASPKCDGSTIPLTGVALSSTIGSVRDRVQVEALDRSVGASKLKLWVGGKPATLRQTLAYWNVAEGETIEFTLGK